MMGSSSRSRNLEKWEKEVRGEIATLRAATVVAAAAVIPPMSAAPCSSFVRFEHCYGNPT